jgi:hypothetical protein
MNPFQNQKENEFMQFFKSICESKYAQKGATLMEIFVEFNNPEINNPEITMKMIETNLNGLYENGFCRIINYLSGNDKRYLYQEPFQASEMGASSSISNSVNNLPSSEFFNQFFQTTLKTNVELKSTFHEILSINQQMLAQQNKILEALNKNTGTIENLKSMTTIMPTPSQTLSSEFVKSLGPQKMSMQSKYDSEEDDIPPKKKSMQSKFDSEEEEMPGKKKSAPKKQKVTQQYSDTDSDEMPPLEKVKNKANTASDSESDSESSAEKPKKKANVVPDSDSEDMPPSKKVPPKKKVMPKDKSVFNASSAAEKVSVVPGSNDKMKVKSFTGGEAYDVNIVSNTCTCANYEFVQSTKNPPGQCKHLKAAHEVVGTTVN